MSTDQKGKLTFPCEFTFKIIGLANNEFEVAALTIMRNHFPQLGEGAITSNLSKNGKYLAYTATVHVISQAQLDAAYKDLSAHPLVLFAL
ncbi:MAG: YbeD family protein [Candidatus Berkiella sp.]